MNGWTFGPGFETMLTNNLSAKLEYRYSQFGRQTIGSTGISMEPSTHAIRAGLSYRFGGLGVVSSDQSFAGSSQPFNWTGVYLGGAIGGGMGFAQTNTFAGPASTSFNSGSQGLLGGFFGGGDWQFSPQALVGVMADYTFQGITGGINLNDARRQRLRHGRAEPAVERDGPPWLAAGAVDAALCGGRLQPAQCARIGRRLARRRARRSASATRASAASRSDRASRRR